ncbi:MAG TPA: 4-alpha-glucanotransferase, partial [Chthoniobacterales bacterium]|nr:4-alpha-glucanotransferase [Chthoniobacterales bacterium]
ISAVAIEPTTLHLAPGSPAHLTSADFEEVVVRFDLNKLRKGSVRHDQVRKLKTALLEKAFRRFAESADDTSSFDKFCETEAAWLNDYSFFRALMHENGGHETWDRWREEHRDPAAAQNWLRAQSPEKQTEFTGRTRFYRYVQWIAEQQWQATRAYAEERGVALMGDIPFGVSLYSADVYTHRDQFALDWAGGAPPEPYFKDDAFTQKWGQNWGIPLYRWDVMRSRNLDWWRWRVRGVRKIFHIYRIDHVLGFYRIYAFPWRPTRNKEFLPLSWEEMLGRTGGAFPQFYPRDDSNPENCEGNRREGEEYLRAVLEESRNTRVVGEDLGTVPDYVRPSLRSLGIAGFKIPQWENYPDGRSIPGYEYQRLSVATYATHDHKPVRAMWEDAFEETSAETEQARNDLMKIAAFSRMAPPGAETDYDRDFYPAIMNALFECESWIALVMITDLLARKDRFNVPGTAAGSNWSRRLGKTVDGLKQSARVRKRMQLIRELLEKAGRIS